MNGQRNGGGDFAEGAEARPGMVLQLDTSGSVLMKGTDADVGYRAASLRRWKTSDVSLYQGCNATSG